jgi:hypothetical protein
MALWQRRLGGAVTAVVVGAVAVGMSVSPNARITPGECRTVNGADVCAWAETANDTLRTFGVTVPIQAIENAPSDAPMVWPPVPAATIPLPDVVRSASGFDNLTVYWEPHGHPPGAYLAPHFDFHFNAISTADVAAIDCSDLTKPSRLSAGYEMPDIAIPNMGTLVGLCVPGMGMHSLPASELRSATPFQKTMVFGYYHARPIFLEPMLTRETLLRRRSFTLDVPHVPGQPITTRAPTLFRAEWDGTTQSYRFVFSGLVTSTR